MKPYCDHEVEPILHDGDFCCPKCGAVNTEWNRHYISMEGLQDTHNPVQRGLKYPVGTQDDMTSPANIGTAMMLKGKRGDFAGKHCEPQLEGDGYATGQRAGKGEQVEYWWICKICNHTPHSHRGNQNFNIDKEIDNHMKPYQAMNILKREFHECTVEGCECEHYEPYKPTERQDHTLADFVAFAAVKNDFLFAKYKQRVQKHSMDLKMDQNAFDAYGAQADRIFSNTLTLIPLLVADGALAAMPFGGEVDREKYEKVVQSFLRNSAAFEDFFRTLRQRVMLNQQQSVSLQARPMSLPAVEMR